MIKIEFNRIINFLFHIEETNLILNSFIIGNNLYIIFENYKHDPFINSPLIKRLYQLGIRFNYYRSYEELEYQYSKLEEEKEINFLIIG